MGNGAGVLLPEGDLNVEELAKEYRKDPKKWDAVIAAVKSGAVDTRTSSGKSTSSVSESTKWADTVVKYSNEIATEINKVRSDPPAYARFIREGHLTRFVDDVVYKSSANGGVHISTHEGKQGVLETISFLEGLQGPLPPVAPRRELELASGDHVTDIIVNKCDGHDGTDGSTVRDRIERYCQWRGTIGENIDFGSDLAADIVTNLLIDDGVPSRGHRLNIVNKEFLVVGATVGPHAEYGHCCVMDFAKSVVRLDDIATDDCTVTLQSLDDLNNEHTLKVIASIPYKGDLLEDIGTSLNEDPELRIVIEFQASIKKASISNVRKGQTAVRTLTWG
jgi:uncharacterized protein YkwD